MTENVRKVLTTYSLTSYYNSLSNGDISDIISAWYPYDEPKTGTWYPIKHCKEIMQSNAETHDMDIMESVTYGYLGHSQKVANIVEKTDMPDAFIQMHSFYPLSCAVSRYSSSDSSDTNIQVNLDYSIARLENAYNVAKDEGLNFIPILYPNGANDRENEVVASLEALGPDIKLHAYLCVAYGADGIGYYRLLSTGKLPEDDEIPRPFRHHVELASYDKSSCPPIDTSVITWGERSFIIQNSQGDWVRVNGEDSWYKWDAGAEVHATLDTLADILNNRTFNGAGKWDDLSESDFTYISSKKFDHDEVFVQWAEFTSGGITYYMLINRRTWPDSSTAPNGLSDSQTVFYSTNLSVSHDCIAIDMVTGDTIPVVDSAGKATGAVFLPPGEAAILKFDTSVTYIWEDSFAPFAGFPEGGTHYIEDVITIDSGSSFTIKKGNTIKGRTLISRISVKGHLEIDGISTDSVILTNDSVVTSSWGGVHITLNGTGNIGYARISHASTGYRNTSSSSVMDTVRSCRIDSFSNYGMYVTKDSVYVADTHVETLESGTTGIHVGGDAYFDFCTIDRSTMGVIVDDAAPSLNQCYFWWPYNSAIRVQNRYCSDTVRIDSCTFYQCPNGLVVQQDYSKILFDYCEFDMVWNYAVVNIFDSAFVGIQRCLFQMWGSSDTVHTAVYSKGGNVDLGGGAASTGWNKFDYDANQACYYIYNSHSSSITYADSCGFDDWPMWPQKVFEEAGRVHIWDSTVISDYWMPADSVQGTPKRMVPEENLGEPLPLEFAISQNYPNPFNPSTTIDYFVPVACHVHISVYNILGQIVCNLVDCDHEPGQYTIVWDSKDMRDRRVSSGVYFFKMQANDFISTKKMVVLK